MPYYRTPAQSTILEAMEMSQYWKFDGRGEFCIISSMKRIIQQNELLGVVTPSQPLKYSSVWIEDV